MKRVLICFIILLQLGCTSDDYLGFYESEGIAPPDSLDEDKKKKMLDYNERNKTILQITEDNLVVYMPNIDSEGSVKIPYSISGKTLIASDNAEEFFVFYLRDKNAIFTTGARYNRIADIDIP